MLFPPRVRVSFSRPGAEGLGMGVYQGRPSVDFMTPRWHWRAVRRGSTGEGLTSKGKGFSRARTLVSLPTAECGHRHRCSRSCWWRCGCASSVRSRGPSLFPGGVFWDHDGPLTVGYRRGHRLHGGPAERPGADTRPSCSARLPPFSLPTGDSVLGIQVSWHATYIC